MTARGARLGRGFCAALLAAWFGAGSGGCTPSPPVETPRIDMTTDETAARSMEKVRDSLDEADRRRLVDATVLLVRRALGDDPQARAAAIDPVSARGAIASVLDGKTAFEVIAEAEAVAGGPIVAGPPGRAASGED